LPYLLNHLFAFNGFIWAQPARQQPFVNLKNLRFGKESPDQH
jgi:hypothetical protein